MSPVLERDRVVHVDSAILSPRNFSSVIIEFVQQHPFAIAFAAAALFLILKWHLVPKQKLVPGVPIVGGNSKKEILASRKRFIHESKDMLVEGYEQV